MRLADILKLNNDVENLNLIQDYFEKTISQYEFEAALNKYLKIASINNLFKLGLEEGLKLLNLVESQDPTKFRDDIYYQLIHLAISSEQYDVAEELIDKRKVVLPQLKSYLSLIDEYHLLKAQNIDVFETLSNLKYEVLPLDVKIFVNEQLYDYYINNNLYDEAIKVLEDLKADTLNTKYDNLLVETYFNKNDFNKVLELAQNLLDENIINENGIAYYLISLIKLRHYNLASDVEAEYEAFFDNSDNLAIKKLVYEEIIKLYEQVYSQPSIKAYKEKLSRVNRALRKETPTTKQEVVKEVEVKEVKTTKLISHAKYLEHFKWINEWLVFSQSINTNVIFREYLRTLFIEINKKVNLLEAVIYLNSDEDSNLFNYKNNRLYDKKIINYQLEETIFQEMLNKETDIFGSPNSLVYKKDVLTKLPFTDEVKFVYGFYINKNFLVSFYLNEEVVDPAIYYELFLGIKTIIHLRLLNLNMQKSLISDQKYLTNLLNNPVMPMRVLTEDNINYNEVAMNLFNIDRKHHLELFLRELNLVDAKMYEQTIKRLFNYPNEVKKIQYQYQNLIIVEYLYAYKVSDEIKIISYFIDATENFATEEALTEKVRFDAETKLLSKATLEEDFVDIIKNKATFMLIELNTDIKDVYGANRTLKYFVEFANINLKHFNKAIYRYDFNKILVVLDINDIRAVKNVVDDYLLMLNHLNSQVLKYEKFNVNISTLRYPVVTTDKQMSNIFKYLDLALIRAKQRRRFYLDFEYHIYEEEIYEQEIIDYLNNAIEQQQLSLEFNQVIDIKKNVVYEYESELIIPNVNIDSKYLIEIAKRRNKLISLEYYHLELAISFIRKLDDETNHTINISVPISKETFMNSDFDSYLIQTLKKYNVSAKKIRLILEEELTTQKSIFKAQKLIKYGVNIDIFNIDLALIAEFSAAHISYRGANRNYKTYIKEVNQMLEGMSVNLIVRDVDTLKERQEVKSLGITYVVGKSYKKVSLEKILQLIKDLNK